MPPETLIKFSTANILLWPTTKQSSLWRTVSKTEEAQLMANV
jgi:hypothetical protein